MTTDIETLHFVELEPEGDMIPDLGNAENVGNWNQSQRRIPMTPHGTSWPSYQVLRHSAYFILIEDLHQD